MNTITRTRYFWISFIKQIRFGRLLILIILGFILLNLFFSCLYYHFNIFENWSSFLDYFYFSCITSFTVGYGDLYPHTDLGKILVIVHVFITYISFTLIISILTIKLFYPRQTIKFSGKMFVDRKKKIIGFRVLNTHREPLINPDIRVHYSEHCEGNVIAKTHSLKVFDYLPFLGKHDFTLMTSVDDNFLSNLDQAVTHDNSSKGKKSRFRIIVSITGNNEIQQIGQIKTYYPLDIKDGISFKAIQYNEEDQKEWGNIDYQKFGNFLTDFETII